MKIPLYFSKVIIQHPCLWLSKDIIFCCSSLHWCRIPCIMKFLLHFFMPSVQMLLLISFLSFYVQAAVLPDLVICESEPTVSSGSGVWWYGLNELAQDMDRWQALVNVVMNLQVPKNAGNFLITWEPVSLSRRILLHGVSKQVVCWQLTTIIGQKATHTSATHKWKLCGKAG